MIDEPGHRVNVRPYTVRAWHRDLLCDVRRVVGYRLECSCGGRGRVRTTTAEARAQPVVHRGSSASG